MDRRDFLKTAAGSLLAAGTTALGAEGKKGIVAPPPVVRKPGGGDPRMRGPFPILSTPYYDDASVDFETLGRAAQFVDDCRSPGVIWCQSNDAVDLLTYEEKIKGFEALAKAMQGRKTVLTLGCQGADLRAMTKLAEYVEALADRYPKTQIAIASRPPDNGKTEADIEKYYEALGAISRRPVIIQTYVNSTCPPPSVDLLIRLAKKFPQTFGYIKEESEGWKANQRQLQEAAAKPVIHTVFSAWGGWQWLYQSRRNGTEGLVTERCAYADLLRYIWDRMENGNADGMLDQAFAMFMLMMNLSRTLPGGDLRGWSLYVFKKRGIFKNLVSREYAKKDTPGKWKRSELKLSQTQMDEVDARLAALRPFLTVL